MFCEETWKPVRVCVCVRAGSGHQSISEHSGLVGPRTLLCTQITHIRRKEEGRRDEHFTSSLLHRLCPKELQPMSVDRHLGFAGRWWGRKN